MTRAYSEAAEVLDITCLGEVNRLYYRIITNRLQFRKK